MRTSESRRMSSRKLLLAFGVLVVVSAAVIGLRYHDDARIPHLAILAAQVKVNVGADPPPAVLANFDALKDPEMGVRAGPAVAIQVTWKADGELRSDCDFTFAFQVPSDWHLSGWASDRGASSGFDSPFGKVIDENPGVLSQEMPTVTTGTAVEGRLITVWPVPDSTFNAPLPGTEVHLAVTCDSRRFEYQLFDAHIQG